jgi:hypothetical protein
VTRPAAALPGEFIDADNHASLALLAGAGQMSSTVTHKGVVDVTVDLPAA